jgi:hypothetical protein
MSAFMNKTDLSPFDYILKFSFSYLNMKKTITDEAVEKIKSNDENEKNI